jgi:hypothetical protein
MLAADGPCSFGLQACFKILVIGKELLVFKPTPIIPRLISRQ